MRRCIARVMSAALLLLLAASCSSILPKPAPPPALYHLAPLPEAPQAHAGIDAQLLVDVPAAPAALDTARIAVSRSAYALDYLADAAWTDRAPLMVQSLIVESLENAGEIRVVARQSPELRADAVLVVDLRRFEAEYQGAGPPEMHVQLDCRLVRMPDRIVLAVKSFDGTARATANDTPAIVAGFNDAFQATMRQLAPWAADSLTTMKR